VAAAGSWGFPAVVGDDDRHNSASDKPKVSYVQEPEISTVLSLEGVAVILSKTDANYSTYWYHC
jgi:hypothetical protein